MNGPIGVVLCGGAGRRMGVDKAMLILEDAPLIEVVAGRLVSITDHVVLAAGHNRFLLPYEHLPDAAPDSGPLAGIVSALRVAGDRCVVVVAVDMPFMSPDLLLALSDLRVDEDAVVPVDPRGPQPLHAVYAPSALPALETALEQGRLSVRRAIEALKVRYVERAEWSRFDPVGRFAFNLNSPEDLDEMHVVHGSLDLEP